MNEENGKSGQRPHRPLQNSKSRHQPMFRSPVARRLVSPKSDESSSIVSSPFHSIPAYSRGAFPIQRSAFDVRCSMFQLWTSPPRRKSAEFHSAFANTELRTQSHPVVSKK